MALQFLQISLGSSDRSTNSTSHGSRKCSLEYGTREFAGGHSLDHGDLHTAPSFSEPGRPHPRSHEKMGQLFMRSDVLERGWGRAGRARGEC